MFKFLKDRKMFNEYSDRLRKLHYMSAALKNQPELNPYVAAREFTQIVVEEAKASGSPECYLDNACTELEERIEAQKAYLQLIIDVFDASYSSSINENGSVTLYPEHIDVALPIIRRFGEPGTESFRSTFKNWLAASLSHRGSIKHQTTEMQVQAHMGQMRTFLVGNVDEKELRATAVEMVLGDDLVERVITDVTRAELVNS